MSSPLSPKFPPVTRVPIDSGLLVSMVRYALGRATYVVSWTIRELRLHWAAIPHRDQLNILRDIAAALDTAHARGGTVGMSIDDQEWRAFLYEVSGDVNPQDDLPLPSALAAAHEALAEHGEAETSTALEDTLAAALAAVVARPDTAPIIEPAASVPGPETEAAAIDTLARHLLWLTGGSGVGAGQYVFSGISAEHMELVTARAQRLCTAPVPGWMAALDSLRS
ncbi:hypothetical protein ACXR2T_08130 [Leucobacter sp. HY1910]